MRITVLGSINTDLTINVPHLSGRNETVVGLGDYILTQGGKGANQAVSAAAAGAEVSFIGNVGADDFGTRALESLEAAGVDCSFVQKSPNHSTGLAAILVDQNGDNSISVAAGANAAMTAAAVEQAGAAIENAGILMIQLEIPLDAVYAAIRLANKHGTRIILDPAPAPVGALEQLDLVDYLTPNEVEAEALTGVSTHAADGPDRIADKLLEAGTRNVILTLGERGCFIANADGRQLIPAHKVTAVDSTGAGDTFNGFLATALVKGMELERAVKMASAAAALAVMQPGARENLPDWAGVEAFMAG